MLEATIRVANSSNVGTTGLTGTNIKFRRSPFGSGDEITIAGVSGGTNGIYLCSFIGVPYQVAQLWIDGVYQATWGSKFIGDVSEEFLSKDDTASQTMAGAIAMGTNKITGLGAGTANGDAVRWEQAGVITEARTITGVWTFDNAIPRVNSPTTTGYPTSNVHLTNKYYVDTLFAGAVGVVQSTNLIKCLPTRSTEDNYSKTTVEKCNAYLSGLSNIATYRGTMLIEALGQTGNAINLDDGSSDWISAGVDIVGLNRPVLTRRGYNSSLTVDGSLSGVKIVDDTVVSSRAYVNFTFKDCWFYVNSTEIAFTTCKFYNCVFQFSVGDTVTFSNCTGSGLTYNDDASVTFTGTQPANIISTNTANIGF